MAHCQQLQQQHPAADANSQPQLTLAQLAVELAALQQASARNEFDDERMVLLATYSGPYQQQVLHILDALNDFDFPAAQHQLALLQQRLTDGAV